MAKPSKRKAGTASVSAAGTAASTASSRRKCACTRCQCMVAVGQGYRKGNMIYCGEPCATKCRRDHCLCGHDNCAME